MCNSFDLLYPVYVYIVCLEGFAEENNYNNGMMVKVKVCLQKVRLIRTLTLYFFLCIQYLKQI